MNYPHDAVKDRGEIDTDRCPDCWHDVEDCVCEPEPEADFLVQNEGTIYLFRPLTAAAAAHLEENVQEDAQWIGGALVVEHRYAPALAVALKEEGFTLR